MTVFGDAPAGAVPCLSIRQPWTHVILHLGKRIENRPWFTNYRGSLLLHAGLSVGTRAEFHDDVESLADAVGEEAFLDFRDEHLDVESPRAREMDPVWRPRSSLLRGGIVGRAQIVGCSNVWGEITSLARGAGALVWWVRGRFGLVLEDVEPLPFMPCKGALGLFRPPAEVLAAIAKHDAEKGARA